MTYSTVNHQIFGNQGTIPHDYPPRQANLYYLGCLGFLIHKDWLCIVKAKEQITYKLLDDGAVSREIADVSGAGGWVLTLRTKR